MNLLIKITLICSIAFTFILKNHNTYAGSYTIGVENISYYPHYDQQDGEYIGFAREIFDAFGNHKGYQFKYKIRPIKRLFMEFVDRKSLDFKYPDCSKWESRRKKGKNILYSQPVVDYIDGFMVLPTRKGSGDKKIKRVGVPLGFTHWPEIQRLNGGNVRIIENKSFAGLLQQAIKKRVDGVGQINISVARYQLEEVLQQNGSLIFDQSLPYRKGSYYLSTIRYPGVLQEFNQFMQDKKNLVKSIKRKYKLNLI